jgi:hypothetical protein
VGVARNQIPRPVISLRSLRFCTRNFGVGSAVRNQIPRPGISRIGGVGGAEGFVSFEEADRLFDAAESARFPVPAEASTSLHDQNLRAVMPRPFIRLGARVIPEAVERSTSDFCASRDTKKAAGALSGARRLLDFIDVSVRVIVEVPQADRAP